MAMVTMRRRLALVLVLVWVAWGSNEAALDPEELEEQDEELEMDGFSTHTVVMEHALGSDGAWAKRGQQLTVRIPSALTPGSRGALRPEILSPPSVKIVGEDAQRFKALVERGGRYRIRARSAPGAPYVIASIAACELAHASLEEDITLHVNDEGHVSGIDYQTTRGHQGCTVGALPEDAGALAEGEEEDEEDTAAEEGRVVLVTRAEALLPKVAAAVPTKTRLAPGAASSRPPNSQAALAAAGEKGDGQGEEKPQPGFFRRYWYIILPMMLFLLSAPAPEEAGQGGGGGGGGGGAGRAAARGGGGGGQRRQHPSMRNRRS
eukprot:g7466.t1